MSRGIYDLSKKHERSVLTKQDAPTSSGFGALAAEDADVASLPLFGGAPRKSDGAGRYFFSRTS